MTPAMGLSDRTRCGHGSNGNNWSLNGSWSGTMTGASRLEKMKNMTIQPRLIVTGQTPEGKSVVLADRPADPTTVRAYPGSEFFLLWGTSDGGATVGGSAHREPQVLPFFAGPGGTRLLLARYAPEASTSPPEGDADELADEVDAKLPGLRAVFDPDDTSGMHATDTLDYGICLEGELVLELDEAEVLLTPGSCVVQQGTRHTWHNRGTTPALMCFVGVGATREA